MKPTGPPTDNWLSFVSFRLRADITECPSQEIKQIQEKSAKELADLRQQLKELQEQSAESLHKVAEDRYDQPNESRSDLVPRFSLDLSLSL